MKSSAQGSTRALVQHKSFLLREFKMFTKMFTFPLKSLQKQRKSINIKVSTTSFGGEGDGDGICVVCAGEGTVQTETHTYSVLSAVIIVSAMCTAAQLTPTRVSGRSAVR